MSWFKKLFSITEEAITTPRILLEESSPNCPIIATVEQDNRTAYFYLWGQEGSSFGVKSCWIRNLKPAPKSLEYQIIEKGFPPMLPVANCAHPQGKEPLVEEHLKIVWLEEGDSAALLENGELIAIIPSWGGQGGFHGYARDCMGQGAFASELPSTPTIEDRVMTAQKYWNSWQQSQDPWQTLKPQLLQQYTDTFGPYDQYLPIDNGQWPPKGLYLKTEASPKLFLTLGVSLRPQPMVELYTDQPLSMNRIELGFMTSSSLKDQELEELKQWISIQTQFPWQQITWLGEGHTIQCDVFEKKDFEAILLTNKLSAFPKIQLPELWGASPNLLWMVPITENEKDFAIEHGSQKLIEKLEALGPNILSLVRKEVKV